MRFISWNIDSLNAALTSDSNRAVLTRKVMDTILAKDPDVIAFQEKKLPANGPSKKHIECLEAVFKDYNYNWRSSQEPARKGY